jgi:hypothetical protein
MIEAWNNRVLLQGIDALMNKMALAAKGYGALWQIPV